MPIHRIQGPDGKIHRIEAPKDANPQQLTAFVASKLAPKEEPGFFDVVQSYTTDIPVRAVKGALGGVESITNIFGADNAVSEMLEGAQEGINEYLVSDTAKQEALKRSKRLEGKGFLGTLAEVPGILKDDPALLFEVLGSAAPAIAATALTGGAGAVVQGAAALGTGAAMGVGATKESIFDATKNEFLKAGASKKEAIAAAQEAQSYLGKNTDMIALGGALGALASRTGLEPTAARMLAGRVLGKSVSQSAGREAIETALKSAAEKGAIRTGLVEAGTEGAQGAQEVMAGNLARSREGFDVDVMEGVGQAAALEGTLGGIAGAGVGLAGRSDAASRAAEAEAEIVKEERAARPSAFRAPEDFSRDSVAQAINSAVGEDASFEAVQLAKRIQRKLDNDLNIGSDTSIASTEAFIEKTQDSLDAGGVSEAAIEPLTRALDTARGIVTNYKVNVLGAEPAAPVEEVAPVSTTQFTVEGDNAEEIKAQLDERFAAINEEAAKARAEIRGQTEAVPTMPADGIVPIMSAEETVSAAPVEAVEPVAASPAPKISPLPVRNASEFVGANRALVKFSNAFENAGAIDKTLREQTGLAELPEGLSLEAAFTPLRAKQGGIGKVLEREYISPLLSSVKTSAIPLQDWGMFFLARAAPAKNAIVRDRNPDFPEAGSGIDDAEAASIIEDLKERGLLPKMEQVAKLHDKLVDRMLEMRVENDILSSDEAIALRRAQPFYTPFKGFSAEDDLTADATEDRDTQIQAFQKARGNARTKEFMQAGGRESLPFHPLFSLISDAESLARRIPENEAASTVLRMVEASPEAMSQFVSGVYTDMRPEVERRMGEMVPLNMKAEVSKNPKNYIVAKRNGETVYLKYNTATDGGAALQEMFTALTPDQLTGAMAVWSGINNTLKSLLTYRNPLYLAAMAPLRDISDAVATAFAAQNVKGTPAFKKKLGLKVLKYSMPGSGTWGLVTRFINDRDAPPGREEDMAMLKRMVVAGGAPMQILFQTASDGGLKMKKDLERYAAKQRGDPAASIAGAASAVTSALDSWADINDLIPRYATFRAAVEEGLTDTQAAALALDSSLNLTRRGTMTRITDNVAPFFSAGFEGSRKFVRIMKNPRTMFKVAGSLMVLGIIESLLNAGMTDDENEDGTPDYLDVSKGTRMSRLVFFYGPGGDDHVDIPIGHMLGYMKYIGNKLADTALGVTDGEEASAAITGATWDLTTGLFSLLSPARVQGGDLATSITSLMPLGLKPFVEAANNKNFFGTSIYTEHRENSGPASEMGRMTTGEIWKSLAKAVNEVSGGGPATSGYADFQPEVYEHIIDSLLGGAYDLISQTGKVIEEPKATNVPVLQGFLGKGFDYVPQTKYKKNTAVLAQWKARVDDIPVEQMKAEMAKRKVDADPRVIDAFIATEKELRRLARERKAVSELTKDKTELRAIADYYRAEMNQFQNAFNSVYDSTRKTKDKE